MMRITFISALLASVILLPAAHAETDIFGEDENSIFEDTAPQATDASKNEISSFLESRLPASMLLNIKKKEKIFCYIVDYATPTYEGYMVNDMALKGYCGELSHEGEKLITDVVLKNTSLYSNNVENCNVAPKFMLRYVNGIDHTDVLFSSPCPSLTFFHGRDIITINATPGKDVLEKIINAYVGLNEKFLSPALLDQMVGNGQIITQDQKEIVRRLSPTEAPLKKWNTENENTVAPNTETKVKASGWNRLK